MNKEQPTNDTPEGVKCSRRECGKLVLGPRFQVTIDRHDGKRVLPFCSSTCYKWYKMPPGTNVMEVYVGNIR